MHDPSLRVTAADNQPIGKGYLTHQSIPLILQVGLFHTEKLVLYIISPKNPIIFDFPWLQHHNPYVSWKVGELVRWLPHCIKNCLQDHMSCLCLTTLVESPAGVGAANIPREYDNLKEVFSK